MLPIAVLGMTLQSTPPASHADGHLPLGSPLYVERPFEPAFHESILRRDPIVLVKGAQQTGKTSLLVRGLDRARRRERNGVHRSGV